jgi:hypothetical protein
MSIRIRKVKSPADAGFSFTIRGFAQVLMRVELHGRPRKERSALERRWRKERRRAVPSPSAVFRYFEAFHDAEDAEEEAKRIAGKAFIPAPTEALKALYRINRELLAFKQAKSPQKTATVDMDATLVETHKRLGSVLLSRIRGLSASHALLAREAHGLRYAAMARPPGLRLPPIRTCSAMDAVSLWPIKARTRG